jgi:uncharacterized protein (DUF2062 family)
MKKSKLSAKKDKGSLIHLSRRSVACGVAAGLFAAFIPLPIQTICAILLAGVLNGNVIVAAGCTWISNPITFVPLNYAIYKVGQFITGDTTEYQRIRDFDFTGNWTQILEEFLVWFKTLGKPFLVGLPVVAISSAVLGFVIVYVFWGVIIKYHKFKH